MAVRIEGRGAGRRSGLIHAIRERVVITLDLTVVGGLRSSRHSEVTPQRRNHASRGRRANSPQRDHLKYGLSQIQRPFLHIVERQDKSAESL
jgi:hypothetical protein